MADGNGDDHEIMNMIHQFNININQIILSHVPELAEAIAKSASPTEKTIEDVVNRLLDKMTDLTLNKFANYGVI